MTLASRPTLGQLHSTEVEESPPPPRVLSVEDILATDDIETTLVPVPQWRGAVVVRTFSKATLQRLQAQATVTDRFGKERVDNAKLEALLFTAGVIDPVFTEEQYQQLNEKSAVAVGRVMKAILKVNGLSEEAIREADKSADSHVNGQV